MDKKMAIITVNYENYPVTDQFISYLSAQLGPNVHLFISDLSSEKKSIQQNDNVTVVSGENKGYAHGINLGTHKALEKGFTQFVVINNDTRPDKNFIHNVKKSLDKHPSSLIGGKIYYEKGYEYHEDRYTEKDLGNVLWYGGGTTDWKNAYSVHRGVDEVDHGQYDKEEKTDFVTGCLMCFDKQVLEQLCCWDESYFLYYEDADYCEKAKKKGIELWYDPSLVIWHQNAASTGGSGSKLHEKYQEKNRLKFGIKYAPWKTKLHLLKNYLLSGAN